MPADDWRHAVSVLQKLVDYFKPSSAHLANEASLEQILQALQAVAMLLAVDLGRRRVYPGQQVGFLEGSSAGRDTAPPSSTRSMAALPDGLTSQC